MIQQSSVDLNLVKSGTIFNDSYEAVKEICKLFPNCIGVVCCAFGIVYSYYSDDTMSKEVATLDYNYEGIEAKNSLFGYNYKLTWKI